MSTQLNFTSRALTPVDTPKPGFRFPQLRRQAAILASAALLSVALQFIPQAAHANDRWYGPASLGGIVTSGIDATSDGPGRYHVFARGSDNALWYRWYDHNGGWRNWDSLGKPLGQDMTGDPTAVSAEPGLIDVFVPITGGSLAHISSVYWGTWGSWDNVGGNIAGGADAASMYPGRIDVVAAGRKDGRLVHMVYDRARNARWLTTPDSSLITSDPALVALPGGYLQAFARDFTGGMKSRIYDGDWGTWQPLPYDDFNSAPAAVAQQGRTDVFAVGWGGTMFQSTQRNGVWSSWQPLAGVYADGPGAASFAPGRVDVFTRGHRDSDVLQLWTS